MYIDSLYQSTSAEGVLSLTEAVRASGIPTRESGFSSWGMDTVSFSQEAIDLQKEATMVPSTVDEDEEESDTLAAFREYMEQAKGESSSADGSQLDKLRKQMEQLNSRLQQVASGTLPEDTKASMISSLQAQIAAVQAEISELMSAEA